MQAARIHKYVLPVIVLSQFAGTSIWFVGNAVLPELQLSLHLSKYAVSLVTTAVMLGFVAGTLVFAFLSLADRYPPARLFFVSSLLGAITNASIAWLATDGDSLFLLRFLTGFFLAGIYPVGMKIAADWFEKGLGKALGYLVGALVLGTAFPHLLRDRDFELPWKTVLYCTSAFAVVGGFLILWLGDGPFRRKAGGFKWNAIPEIFRSVPWRRAAFGYFGHMWELYTFWGFVPVILSLYATVNHTILNVPLLSFFVIALGCIACVSGGYLSQKIGSAKVATGALVISGVCCLVSPMIFAAPFILFMFMLIVWGWTVITDSPQFSALVAEYAPASLRGTALTIYNSIGFSIASLSLYVVDRVFHSNSIMAGKNTFLLLGIGALLGLPPMFRLIVQRQKNSLEKT